MSRKETRYFSGSCNMGFGLCLFFTKAVYKTGEIRQIRTIIKIDSSNGIGDRILIVADNTEIRFFCHANEGSAKGEFIVYFIIESHPKVVSGLLTKRGIVFVMNIDRQA